MPFCKSAARPRFESSCLGELSDLHETINERVKGQGGAAELIRGLGDEEGAGGERVGLARR